MDRTESIPALQSPDGPHLTVFSLTTRSANSSSNKEIIVLPTKASSSASEIVQSCPAKSDNVASSSTEFAEPPLLQQPQHWVQC
ncbi:hypothetical protein PI125_g9386 [Phytophthora idaei]|nr:hypothetical protein PI125_g9386 [Phytophthora idaei]